MHDFTTHYRQTIPAAFLRRIYDIRDPITDFVSSGVAIADQCGDIIHLSGWRLAFPSDSPNAAMVQEAHRSSGAGNWSLGYSIRVEDEHGTNPQFTLTAIKRVGDLDTCPPPLPQVSIDAATCTDEELRRAGLVIIQAMAERAASAGVVEKEMSKQWSVIADSHMRRCAHQYGADELARLVGQFERWADACVDDLLGTLTEVSYD